MTQPTLYLMLGYPGAGKTTASEIIGRITGARHLWADLERRKLFTRPTFSHKENILLYDSLNKKTAELLSSGTSVIFDTGFNFKNDRRRLRSIAAQAGAKTLLVWVDIPKEIAKKRATIDSHKHKTRVLGAMTEVDFNRMSEVMQLPESTETFIKLNGTEITETNIKKVIGNN